MCGLQIENRICCLTDLIVVILGRGIRNGTDTAAGFFGGTDRIECIFQYDGILRGNMIERADGKVDFTGAFAKLQLCTCQDAVKIMV